MKKLITLFCSIILSFNIHAQCEGFINGTTPPSGWVFSNIGGTYISTGNYGASSPSLQLNATGDQITTPIYSGNVSMLSFWLKGQGTDGSSTFNVEGSNNGGTNWTVIETFAPSTTGSTKTYSTTFSKFRFTYTKNVGNLAFDDVCITATSSVLPIAFNKFEAKRNQNKVNLNWATATELNNDHFEVQHSDNGEDYKTIGQLKGNGTTAVGEVYNFEHMTPSVGINYYRLKQVDVDGKYEYSPIRSVLFGKNKISVSPTFAKESVTIYVSDDQSTSFGIYNLAGQQVLSGKAIGQQRIDVGFLQTGMYFIRTEFGDVIRFIKE